MPRTDKKTQISAATRKKGRVSSGRGPVLFFGLALVTVLTLYFFFRPALLETANNRIYDILLRSIPHSAPSSLPVIVDIDDESLELFGQWPWPRYRIARLLEKINALGPRSVALDMFFPELDRTSLDHLQNQIKHDFNVRLNLSNVAENIRDNDAFFAQRLAAGPFVLGYKFIFDTNPSASSDCLLSPAPVFVLRSKGTTDDHSPLMTAHGAVCNIQALS